MPRSQYFFDLSRALSSICELLTFSKFPYYLVLIYSYHSINPFSECNRSFTETTNNTKDLIEATLPNLFQNNIICAGNDLGIEGSCKGDSGGPMMIKDRMEKKCN
jgi:hypothetical protein